jgi:hypothetical protein
MSVILSGKQPQLLFTSGLQVNVALPYDAPVNSAQQTGDTERIRDFDRSIS